MTAYMATPDDLLVAFETHSVERIREILDAGFDVRMPVNGVNRRWRQHMGDELDDGVSAQWRLTLQIAGQLNASFRQNMRIPPSRFIALAVAVLTMARAWPRLPLLEAVAVVDGAALVLIWFARAIDDMTFGTYTRGQRIDAHTPAWMIAGFGWGLLLLMTAVLFWPGHFAT